METFKVFRWELTAKRRLQKNVKYLTHVKPPDAMMLEKGVALLLAG